MRLSNFGEKRRSGIDVRRRIARGLGFSFFDVVKVMIEFGTDSYVHSKGVF